MIEENFEGSNFDIGGGKFVVPIREILTSVIRGRRTLAIAFVAPVILSLVIAIALPTRFDSEAHLLVLPDPQYTAQLLSRDNAPQPNIDSEQISKIEVEILNSRELKRAVAAKLGPSLDSSLSMDAQSGPDYDRALNKAADRLETMITVEPAIDSSIIRVRFSNGSAQLTHDGLSALIDAYLADRLRIFDRDRLPFLLGKRDEAGARLENARSELAAFRKAHDIAAIPDQILLLLDEQTKLTLSAMQARQTVAERSAAGAALTTAAGKLPANVLLSDDRQAESESGNSRSILLGLQLRRQELLSKYADTSHFITDIDQQIAALKSFETANQPKSSRYTAMGINPVAEQIRGDIRQFDQDRAGNEARAQEVERQIETIRQRLLELTGLRLEDRRLERTVELADAQYRILLKHYDDALVADAVDRQSTPNVRVIEFSNPLRAGGSRRLVLGLGILAGLAAAILTAFVIATFRETMLTPSAAARRLGMPVLARVANRENG